MFNKAIISATGVYHPSDIIDNATLVDSYNAYATRFNQQNQEAIEQGQMSALEFSSAEFIEKASGILQRYVIDKQGILDIDRMRPFVEKRPDETLSLHAEFAINSIENCLEKTQTKAQDIDCIIVSCSNFARPYPSIAIEVQQAIGAKGFAYDMNVACSSATFAINAAQNLVTSGTAQSVLVVSPEICSAHLDYTNRDSHFIFGDASTAVLVQNEKICQSTHPFKIHSAQMATQFSNHIRNNNGFLTRAETPTGQQPEIDLFKQNGRIVFKEVVPLAFNHIVNHCEVEKLNSQDIKRYWLHQANSHMNQMISKKLIGDVCQQKAPMILDQYANTASCGSVIAFDHYHEDLEKGDFGVLCSFGAGYSVGSLLVEKM